jgi:cytochrome c2
MFSLSKQNIFDLCATGHVTAYEADNLVGPVEDVVHLMETKATETAAASAALVEAGMTHSSEAISRKQKFEGKCSNCVVARYHKNIRSFPALLMLYNDPC